MTHDSTRSLDASFQTEAELELLQLMLQESVIYPWNPADPEADAYFSALEQAVAEAGWDEEIAIQGERLAAHMDQLWSTVAPVPSAATRILNAPVLQRFAEFVPQQIYERIVEQARQVMDMNLSLADQLVRCVEDCLPNWGEDDLQVLARPFAYAMRGSETDTLEVALRSVRCAAWTELSGVEQARLSLAIARYAIAQLPSIDHPEL